MNLPPVPQSLRRFRTELAPLDPESQAVPYYASTWERYFPDDPDFLWLAREMPGSISRAQLLSLSRTAHADPTMARRLFLASMVWGYGTVGRGPWRTREMMQDLDRDPASDMLALTVERLRAGNLLAAYERLSIRWCGASFMSKFLYFAGLGCEAKPLPLILDSQIARALNVLAPEGGFDTLQYVKTDRAGAVVWFPAGYVRYCRLLADWAADLNCRADALELFLFDPKNHARLLAT